MADRPSQEITIPGDDGDEPRLVHVDPLSGEVLTPDGRPTGRSLSELAAETNLDLRIAGTQPEMDLTGFAPEGLDVKKSVLNIKGGEYVIRGQFRAGEKVVVAMEVEIADVRFGLLKPRGGGPAVGLKRTHETIKADYVRTMAEVIDGTATLIEE